MKKLKTNELRQLWLEFFKDKEHTILDSSSLIPENDKTLLWINAGVAPLKSYFDGSLIPENPRMVNYQKCIRTKDIDVVGFTSRHQTLFEMLGVFSIGDYFREEIIGWIYEFLFSKEYLDFNKNRVYVSIYKGDEETKKTWMDKGVEASHIIETEHNFWEIGNGPCGPCTEIFYDKGFEYGHYEDASTVIKYEKESNRFIEILNIVLSQYNSEVGVDRKDYKELPNKNIDVGVGLERLASIVQETETNFDIDIFEPIMSSISELVGVEYNGQHEFKIIADHIRSVVVALSDGATISNEGRGYILRRLIRRAARYGKDLGVDGEFMYKIVDSVNDTLSDYYPEVTKNLESIKKEIKYEELKFKRTLKSGEAKLMEYMKESEEEKKISGKMAFILYDTYGFPVELTKEICEEKEFKVDMEEFYVNLNDQKERSRSNRKNYSSMSFQNEEFLNFKDESKFTGYKYTKEKTEIVKVFDQGIVLSKTPFYAESGGQVSDIGYIIFDDIQYKVEDVQKLPNGQHLHILDVVDGLSEGNKVVAKIDKYYRRMITRNHSATHILYAAMREVLGDHVRQHGSRVNITGLRFDFSHKRQPIAGELMKLENIVNSKIDENINVKVYTKDKEDLKNMNVIAEFGEKYGSTVRIVDMGYTKDLCGGTHVENTSHIERFAISSIENKGGGIFRITAHAYDSVENISEYLENMNYEIDMFIKKAGEILDLDKSLKFNFEIDKNLKYSYQDVLDRKRALSEVKEAYRNLKRQYDEKNKSDSSELIEELMSKVERNKLITTVNNLEKKSIKPLLDNIISRIGTGFVLLVNVTSEDATFVAKSTGSADCNKIIKKAMEITKGKGGGKKEIAQGGTKNIDLVDDALKVIRKMV